MSDDLGFPQPNSPAPIPGGFSAGSPGPPLPPPPTGSPPVPDIKPSQWKRGRPLPLRPRGVGETIDAAINLYRLHWKVLMTLAAVVIVPFELLNRFVVHVQAKQFIANGHLYDARSPIAVGYLFVIISTLLITPLLRGAMVRAIAGAYMGQEPDWKTSLRFAWSKFGSLLLAIVLSDLAMIGGFILLWIPGIILYIRYTFVSAAVIVEGERGTGALGRSWRLSRGRFWPILGTLLLSAIISSIVTAILVIPSALFSFFPVLGTQTWILQAALTALATVIAAPFGAIIPVLLYFDCRIRSEGFDIAVMAQEVA